MLARPWRRFHSLLFVSIRVYSAALDERATARMHVRPSRKDEYIHCKSAPTHSVSWYYGRLSACSGCLSLPRLGVYTLMLPWCGRGGESKGVITVDSSDKLVGPALTGSTPTLLPDVWVDAWSRECLHRAREGGAGLGGGHEKERSWVAQRDEHRKIKDTPRGSVCSLQALLSARACLSEHVCQCVCQRGSCVCSPLLLQHPYPSEEQKKQLAQDTGLTILQVNNW